MCRVETTKPAVPASEKKLGQLGTRLLISPIIAVVLWLLLSRQCLLQTLYCVLVVPVAVPLDTACCDDKGLPFYYRGGSSKLEHSVLISYSQELHMRRSTKTACYSAPQRTYMALKTGLNFKGIIILVSHSSEVQ